MITFQPLTNNTKFISTLSKTLVSSTFYWVYPVYIQDFSVILSDTIRVRTPSEKLTNSPKLKPAGDRVCDNWQIFADIYPSVVEFTTDLSGLSFTDISINVLIGVLTVKYSTYQFSFSPGLFCIYREPSSYYVFPESSGFYYYKFQNSSKSGTIYMISVIDSNHASQKYVISEIITISRNVTAVIGVTLYYYDTSGTFRTQSIHNASYNRLHANYPILCGAFDNAVCNSLSVYPSTLPGIYNGSKPTALTRYRGVDKTLPTEEKIQQVITKLDRHITFSALPIFYADPDPWDELAYEAVQNMSATSVNSIAFIRDLKKTFGEIKDIFLLLKDPLNIKRWSSAWLGLRYGTRLTFSDLTDLVTAVKDQYREWLRWKKNYFCARSQRLFEDSVVNLPSAISWKRRLVYKVYYTPDKNVFHNMFKALFDWGLFPSYKNCWDLIPLSFVVDWIVGIDKFLEQLDNLMYQEMIKVLGVTYSRKDEIVYNVPLTDLGYQDTTARVVFYYRGIRYTLHPKSLTLQWGSFSGVNIIDAISLLIQRK